MKVFVFVTSKYWSYSGGAILISGTSFKDVEKTFDGFLIEESTRTYEQNKSLYRGSLRPYTLSEEIRSNKNWYKLREEEFDEECDISGYWVLYTILECPNIKEKKVILRILHEG